MPYTRRSDGSQESLLDRYNRFYHLFIFDEGETLGKPPNKLKVEYRRKLFGDGYNLLGDTPDRYSYLSTALAIAPYYEWIKFTIHEQAELIAMKRIENMIQVLERHLEIQRSEREAKANKNKKTANAG